jgi:hypothetical protein
MNLLSYVGQQDIKNIINLILRQKTAWEFADMARPGWQWQYDLTADLTCDEVCLNFFDIRLYWAPGIIHGQPGHNLSVHIL